MFTPGSKRAILYARILARPGETLTRAEIDRLSDAGKATVKFVLNEMLKAGEVTLLTDVFPPVWRVAGKKNGRPSKRAGFRAWLLRYPGETFTSNQLLERYNGDIARHTVLNALADMVRLGKVVKRGNTTGATWTVVESERTGHPGPTLREAAGWPSLAEWESKV